MENMTERRENCSSIPDNPPCDPERWMEQHADYLYRYALLRLRDPRLAEDSVQEAFLAALQARNKFAGRSSERTWLVGILKHKIIDYFRRISRESLLDQVEILSYEREEAFHVTGKRAGHWKEEMAPIDWAANPGTTLEQQEFWEIFERGLSTLPARLAQVFTLREIEGLTTEEICKIMNVSTTNFSVMLHRARAQLRHYLEVNYFRSEVKKSQREKIDLDPKGIKTRASLS